MLDNIQYEVLIIWPENTLDIIANFLPPNMFCNDFTKFVSLHTAMINSSSSGGSSGSKQIGARIKKTSYSFSGYLNKLQQQTS